ncbi:uncharacterized protein C2orf50 homolog [Astyanax mexicanus]|uniref:Uncharacterized protein n=2 Tax=Astyanax mexicanus TaxID=7994 RepID=A0A8B9HBW9_ASTMX|nr:uncharacterized protein C2orf50 homolog [Astyanax mexicanus]KAG9274932.1 hypothetical protein AMEX_G9392 [Astyanax mexicanus]
MERKVTVRRATSAGYRLPERPSVPLASQSSVSVLRPSQSRTRSAGEPPERDTDTRNPVKQDQVWREFVRAERTGVKEWEKNWSFLKDFDQLGRPRTEPPLPTYVPLYSDTLPNTSNQMLGSRMCTELGKELMRMDKLLMLTMSHRKNKQSSEMQPC